MISRVHIKNSNLPKFTLYVSEFIEGPYIKIEKNIIVPHGKERIIKIGSFPCRFIKIGPFNGKQVKINKNEIMIFGLEYSKISEKIEFGAENYLFENTYKLLYGEK